MISGNAPTSSIDLCEILFRHKKKILLTPLVILLAGAAVILWAPRTYNSEAKILLQVGRESVGLDPTATTGNTISLQQNGRDAEIVSAIEVLGSRGVIAKVVDHEEIGPEYVLRGGPARVGGPRSSITDSIMAPIGAMLSSIKDIDPVSIREEAMIKLEKSLIIDTERDSTVIVVSIESKTPEGAQKLLATFLEVYKQEHLRIHRNASSLDFFTEQHELLEKRLEQANNDVRAAKNRMGLASVEGRRSTLEGQLRSIEEVSYRTEQELATALARVGDLRKQTKNIPERMVASRRSVPNDGADLLREQLYALQMRQMDLKARYNDSHPLVVAVSAQLAEAEKIVDEQSESREETTDDVNPIHRALSLELKQQEAALKGYQARLDTLREQKQLVLRDLQQLNRYEVELDDLSREVSLARSKFFKYAENLEQARIDQELEDQNISSVSIAQAPTFTEKPVSPRKGLVGAGAIMLAFGATLSWVAASEQLNTRLRSGEEAEKQLGVPVYAEIPNSKKHGRVLAY